MKRRIQSLSHALSGLGHAIQAEPNLQMFLGGFAVVIVAGVALRIGPWQWLALLISCGTFVAVELLNTALERFVDAFDEYRKMIKPADSHHLGLKRTKDVAAAASLVSLVVVIVTVLAVFVPYLRN